PVPLEPPPRRIGAARGQTATKPSLPLSRVIIGKHLCGALMPSSQNPVPQLHAHPRIPLDIADVPRLHPVFRNDPELIADETISDGSPPRLARFASDGLEERVTRRHDAKRK